MTDWQRFVELVETDDELQRELSVPEDWASFIEVATRLGRARGLDFSAEEVREQLRSAARSAQSHRLTA